MVEWEVLQLTGRLEVLLAFYLLAVSLEFTASFWVRRNRWLGAVAAVNLVTYPPFFFVTPALLETAYGIPIAEVVIAVVEGTVLAALYRFKGWRRMYLASFVMNAFSYWVSLLMI